MGSQPYAAEATAATYGVALGANTLILPLLAIDVGYSSAAVGYLAAVCAASQLVSRLALTAALRRIPDRLLVAISSIILTAAFVLVALSHEPAPFVAAMACQGASRAGFWTGIQTHVVRNSGAVSQSIAKIILVADVGLLAGPILAGFTMESSTSLALYVGMTISVAATGLSLTMKKLPLMDAPTRESTGFSMLRAPVIAGCVGVGVSGSWRGVLGSYVPVVLVHSQQSGGTIGILTALANAASVTAAATLTKLTLRDLGRTVSLCCVGVGLAISLVGFASPWPPAAGACLLVGGYCAGALQILGTALATEAVALAARGQAIALTGTVRAGTMLAAPLMVAALLQAMTLSVALALIGVLHGVPGASRRRRQRT